jgi:hypothetical protein
MKRIPTSRLDRTSLEYLTQVDHNSGNASAGVFIRCPGWNVSPRVGQVIGLGFGIAVAGLSLAAVGFLNFERIDPQTAGFLQALLLALGLKVVIGRLLALFRPVQHSPVGHFLWADCRQLWQVDPEQVKVYPLDEVRSASASHFATHDSHSHSEVFLRLRNGSEVLTVRSRPEAEQLVQFLTARCLLPEENRNPDATVPQPVEMPAAEEANQPGFGLRTLPWGIAVAAVVLGMLTLPGVNNSQREERLYAATVEAAPGEEQPFQRYLEVFPTGRHAEEVRWAFEDNLARYAATSPVGQADRYERCLKLFPQGRRTAQVRSEYEHHLYNSTKGSARGGEEAFQRYLRVFPEGRFATEVRASYEVTLYQATRAARLGEQKPYERYLEVFPQGVHAEAVRTAFEDNLARHAASSPAGQEERYKRYLAIFPKGRLTARVRADYEENLCKFARTSSPEEDGPCKRYLAAFPMGQFAAEIGTLLDERRFTRARNAARKQESPAPLRSYLSDPANKLHRKEAQAQIDEIYEQAILKLKKRTADLRSKEEKAVIDALCSLLEALKRAEKPEVTVRFQARHTDVPADAFTKLSEQIIYRAALEKHPELKDLERETGSAILPRYPLFEPAWVERREGKLRVRLWLELKKVVKLDLIDLMPSGGGDPVLEIAYHVVPSGTLLEYQESLVQRERGGEEQKVTRIRGLLRTYDIQWVIKTRPPGTKKVLEQKLTSKAVTSIHIRSEPADPEWTPYAIQLYLAYCDLSDRLIRNLGGEPEPLPERITFAEAAR